MNIKILKTNFNFNIFPSFNLNIFIKSCFIDLSCENKIEILVNKKRNINIKLYILVNEILEELNIYGMYHFF